MLSLSISSSRMLTLYLLLIHGVMLVTLLSLMAMLWWSLPVILMVALSFSYFYKQANTLNKIEHGDNNSWRCHYKNGQIVERLSLTGSVVTPVFIILYFKRNTVRQGSSIIMADAVDAELFRQLRVFCRNPKTFLK